MRRLGWTMVTDTDQHRLWVRLREDADPNPASLFVDATSLNRT